MWCGNYLEFLPKWFKCLIQDWSFTGPQKYELRRIIIPNWFKQQILKQEFSIARFVLYKVDLRKVLLDYLQYESTRHNRDYVSPVRNRQKFICILLYLELPFQYQLLRKSWKQWDCTFLKKKNKKKSINSTEMATWTSCCLAFKITSFTLFSSRSRPSGIMHPTCSKFKLWAEKSSKNQWHCIPVIQVRIFVILLWKIKQP